MAQKINQQSDLPKRKIKLPFTGSISNLTIALSIKNLSLMLRSGLALGDAIRILAEQTDDDKLKKVWTRISKNIQGGTNLSDSMRQEVNTFSDIIISVVSVGEQGGTLEKNLIFLADYLKKTNDLNKKIKGALIYPGIVFLLTVVEMLGVVFLILPQLEELFATFDDIPPLTQAILNVAEFIRTNSILLAIGIVASILSFIVFLQTGTGRKIRDVVSVNFPVIKNLTKNNTLATFSRTLNILMESGVPIVQGLEITSASVGNSIYKGILKQVYEEVRSGKNLATALEEHPKFFPSTFVRLIEVGEGTGALEENLFFLYEYHSAEVEDLSSNLSTLLEPILLVFIGGMIGLLALIIIGPIYQFTGSIN